MESDPLRRAQGDGLPADGVPGRTLGDDAAFTLLGNGRRRAVIRRLASASGPVRLHELTEAVLASEASTVDRASPEARRVTIALRQIHLPKLDDAGVVAYDRGRNLVTPTPALDALATRLARATTDRTDEGRSRGPDRGEHARPGGGPLAGRAPAAVVAAAATTLLLSGAAVAAVSSTATVLVAAAVVGLAVFGALTLAGVGGRSAGDPDRD